MSSSSSGRTRQRMRDLKQVVPLAIPKETAEPPQEQVIEAGVKMFRKISADKKAAVYLKKVEYQDLGCDTDPVEGFVVFDASRLSPGESLYVALVGRFRYGREEDEVLGMSLCREMYMGHKLVCSKSVYDVSVRGNTGSNIISGSARLAGSSLISGAETQPSQSSQPLTDQPGPSSGVGSKSRQAGQQRRRRRHRRRQAEGLRAEDSKVTEVSDDDDDEDDDENNRDQQADEQEELEEAEEGELDEDEEKDKTKENRVHFSFTFPEDAPVSAVMQRLSADAGDTCGVRYYVRCYASVDLADEHTTVSVLNFPIRKLQFGIPLSHPPPSPPKGNILKDFPLNGGRLALEATLDKAVYEHGEAIRVKINLVNSSHKSVKHVKVTVQQSAQVHLWNTGKLKVTVASTNNRTDCHIGSANSVDQEVVLVPKAGDNKNKYGVFIQGREDDQENPPCLASSTIVPEEVLQDGSYFGIILDYEVKVKLCLAALSSLSGFRTWMCNGVKGLVDDKGVTSSTSCPGGGIGSGAGSPVSSPTKTPSTPAERRGEIACLIPFQIYQRAPSGNGGKSNLAAPRGNSSPTPVIERRVEEITLEE